LAGTPKKNFNTEVAKIAKGGLQFTGKRGVGLDGRSTAGDVFMIRLSDLCDLRVKFLLLAKPSGLNGSPARRRLIYDPVLVIFVISV
jgi:hypothetical protein